jgi:hypothetical protein
MPQRPRFWLFYFAGAILIAFSIGLLAIWSVARTRCDYQLCGSVNAVGEYWIEVAMFVLGLVLGSGAVWEAIRCRRA